MARLRRSDCSGPGITRVRKGEGFMYVDNEGRHVSEPEVLSRIGELVIPPAWKDVWICPYPMGHIQATGVDQAGRKQYLYHPKWRERRDRQKFDEMLAFARGLPDLRACVEDVVTGSDDLGRDRVLAAAVRLLDRGFFRIGSEDYAVTNETFGLATMRKRHVRLLDDDRHLMAFRYPAKSGVVRELPGMIDPVVYDIVSQLKRRRSGGDELLAYKERGRWRDIKSADINAFIKEQTGEDYSAKDFRTWNATTLAAVALGVSGQVATTVTGRKRAITRAIKEVSHYLGNTPAVCRASYIDPRVIDAYQGGTTIYPAIETMVEEMEPGESPHHRPEVEQATIDLIKGVDAQMSAGLERIAA